MFYSIKIVVVFGLLFFTLLVFFVEFIQQGKQRERIMGKKGVKIAIKAFSLQSKRDLL